MLSRIKSPGNSSDDVTTEFSTWDVLNASTKDELRRAYTFPGTGTIGGAYGVYNISALMAIREI